MTIEIVNNTDTYQQAVVGEEYFASFNKNLMTFIHPNLRLRSDDGVKITVSEKMKYNEHRKLKHIRYFSNCKVPYPSDDLIPFYLIQKDANCNIAFRHIILEGCLSPLQNSLYPIIINSLSPLFSVSEKLSFRYDDGFLLTLQPRQIITLTLVFEEENKEVIKKTPEMVSKKKKSKTKRK